MRERLLDEKNRVMKSLVEGRERLRDFWKVLEGVMTESVNGVVQVTV